MSDRYHIKYKWEDPYDWLTDQWSLPVPVLELIRMKMNFDDIQDDLLVLCGVLDYVRERHDIFDVSRVLCRQIFRR